MSRCRWFGHCWYALTYPPFRRTSCTRCGVIVEAAA